jgi:adhesin transport system membrane fusion protein
VSAQGRVIPSAQLQVISNLEGGIVSKILVKTGQVVAAGAPILGLDRTATGAEFGSGEATYGALTAKVARLEAELAGTRPAFPATASPDIVANELRLYSARQADLQSLGGAAQARVMQAQNAVGEAEATLAARTSAREAARTQLDMLRPLVERGIEPRMSLVQAEKDAAVSASEAAAAASGMARAHSAVSEARATLIQQRQEWRARAGDELATARSEMNARARALPALADRMARTIVRAPLAGRINRVLVSTVGGSVRPGDPLVELVPSDESMLVEALVAPKDIAFVRIGQIAKVKVTAYDSAIYGSLDGRVVTISPDAVVDPRTGESHYTVRVRTTRNGLRNGAGAALPIGPGMVADVSLMGDKRTVLDYFLTPITRLRENAFRE